MREFVDLQGATGTFYRFRLCESGQAHLPIAGNYAVVCAGPEGLRILMLGTSEDLSKMRDRLTMRLRKVREAGLYTRLNVSRPIRLAENDDLISHYAPPLDGSPLDGPDLGLCGNE